MNVQLKEGGDIGMFFTIVVKFSRECFLKPFFENFNKLNFDASDCNLILINNTSNKTITGAFLSGWITKQDEFKSILIRQTNKPTVDRYTSQNFKNVPMPFHTMSAYNSFQLIKHINELVRDDIHIQLEDDTLSHPDLIPKLLKIMENSYVDCATSPTPHRQKGFKIVGHNAYEELVFNDQGFLMSRKNTLVYKEEVLEIAGTGYCGVAFRKKAYERGIKEIENLNLRIIGSGSDIYFGRAMKKTICDFSVWNEHMFVEDGKIKKNTIKNTGIWDWKWNKKKWAYDLRLLKGTE